MSKAKYYIKKWGRITLRDTLSPIFNKGQFFQLLTIPIFLILSAPLGGELFQSKIESISIEQLAIILTLPLWLLINALLAPFRLLKEEREEGHWDGCKFIYHSPKHIYTLSSTPSDSLGVQEFTVNDAEPESFVQFKIEYDGGLGTAQIVHHENNALNWQGVTRNTTYGARLSKGKKIKLVTNCPAHSDPTIVRISMLYWEFNKRISKS